MSLKPAYSKEAEGLCLDATVSERSKLIFFPRLSRWLKSHKKSDLLV